MSAGSLKNRKNTRIHRDLDENGCVLSETLIHHGSSTCKIDYENRQVSVCLCGWDTLTTRGKINNFLYENNVLNVKITRVRGVTLINNVSMSVSQVYKFDF